MNTITKCGEYVARNGEIGRVVCVDNARPCPVVVVWPNGNVTVHRADGRSYSDDRDHHLDLIREHREPQKVVFEGVAEGWWVVGEGAEGERNFVRFADPDTPTLTGTRYLVTVEEIMDS